MKKIHIIIVAFLFIGIYTKGQNQFEGLMPDKSVFQILVTPEEINLKDAWLATDPVGFPILYSDSKLISLAFSNQDGKPEYATFPDNLSVEKIVCLSNKRIILKSGSKNFEVNNNRSKLIMDMHNTNFNIFRSAGNSMYVSRDSNLFLLNIETLQSIKLATLPMNISDVWGNGTHTYIAAENMLFYIEGSTLTPILINPTPIKSITGNETILFIASENRIAFMQNPAKAVPFINIDAKQLLYTNDDSLYILSTDGTLSVLNNANLFNQITVK